MSSTRIFATMLGVDRLKAKLQTMNVNCQRNVAKALANGAIMIHSTAVIEIQRGVKTGKVYTHGNRSHQASAPGEAPATDTGNLVNNLLFSFDEHSMSSYVYVRDQCPYGKWLEFGTLDGHLKARPFLRPAFNAHKTAINQAIRAAYRDAKPK